MAFTDPNLLCKYVEATLMKIRRHRNHNNIGSGDFRAMTILPNIDKMIAGSAGSAMENSYKGIGKFSRAYMFYYLTMQMGDIPYSESNKGQSGVFRPKYDSQEKVLIGILDS